MMPFLRFQSGKFHWTSIAVVLRTTTWKEVGGPVGSVGKGEGREYHEGGVHCTCISGILVSIDCKKKVSRYV